MPKIYFLGEKSGEQTVFGDDSGLETSANPDAGEKQPAGDLVLNSGKE
jgi:hypothetical protein